MTTNTNTIEKSRTYYLVINALFIALTLVATWLINIRLPFMGSGGLMSGWTAWAPFTFIIVGCMGYVVGLLAEKKPFKHMMVTNVISIILALIIKVVGYYFAEVILYGNWFAPLGSVPGNVVQVGFAGIIVLLFIQQLRKIVK